MIEKGSGLGPGVGKWSDGIGRGESKSYYKLWASFSFLAIFLHDASYEVEAWKPKALNTLEMLPRIQNRLNFHS